MPIIKVFPHNIEIEASEDKPLLEIFKEEGIFVKSSCGGFAKCCDCVIKIIEGKEHLNEPTFDETQLLGSVFHITRERLSCQTKITGPVSVDLSKHDPEHEEKARPKSIKIRKKGTVKKIKEEEQPRKKGGGRRPRPFRTDHLDPQPDSKKSMK